MKKCLTCLLALLCLLLTAACAQELQGIAIAHIPTYGNLVLDITGTELLTRGYDYGDMINVQIGDAVYTMPVGSDYSDVDSGCMICRVQIDPENGEDNVTLAVYMGSMATETGIARKVTIAEEPGFRWIYTTPDGEAPTITLSMQEKGGYAAQYQMRQLERTNAREDYAHLTDAEFANFRMVTAPDMAAGVLYRSSSPVNPELGRNAYADAALADAGVRTVVNLADTPEGMAAYPGYAETAYASCSHIALNLSVLVLEEDFQQGLAAGLRFMLENEGPYLIHCTEGKDRAGFVSALLECLMGASAEEVAANYMVTYWNYYGVVPGTEQYRLLASGGILTPLAEAFGVADVTAQDVDLRREAEQYMLESLGLKQEEIEALKSRLSGNE